MGDHRCIINLEVQNFHGVSRKISMNINWMGEDDDRITQFFSEVHADGMAAYNEQMSEYFREERQERERDELRILKARYPDV